MKRRVTRKELMRVLKELVDWNADDRKSRLAFRKGYESALIDIAFHFGVTVQRKEQP